MFWYLTALTSVFLLLEGFVVYALYKMDNKNPFYAAKIGLTINILGFFGLLFLGWVEIKVGYGFCDLLGLKQ